MNDLREKLAAYAHKAWSGWMEYLFEKGEQNADGTFTIDVDHVTRWRRQMGTLYAELSEEEKESDRSEADMVIALLQPENEDSIKTFCEDLERLLIDVCHLSEDVHIDIFERRQELLYDLHMALNDVRWHCRKEVVKSIREKINKVL